jgi:hypothetical protein
MKLFLMGGAVGLVLGAGITFLYFSLATLFSANAKASLAQSKAETPLQQEIEAEAAGKTRGAGA